ncbi:hypothetical protein J2P12_05410, partial [Candidatus Bathyarchaeota archaeon]|nr:hypothetical protein [Candidatus Bathyarchaeota archaeon]
MTSCRNAPVTGTSLVMRSASQLVIERALVLNAQHVTRDVTTGKRDVTLMPWFGSSRDEDRSASDANNRDVAKLFFDSFSKRVKEVEDRILSMSADFEKLKMSVDHGQVSDLVLLERLQKAEKMIKDGLESIRTAVERTYAMVPDSHDTDKVQTSLPSLGFPREVGGEAAIASHVMSPTGQMGSLPSITTPTELQVLTLLASEGPKSAPEIGRVVGRSREHTARLMKK